MEEGRVGFIQEALRGFLKCLGLESTGGKDTPPVEGEVVNNPPPPLNPTPQTTYEPLPSVDDPFTTDPLVEALTSSVSNFQINLSAAIMTLSSASLAYIYYVPFVELTEDSSGFVFSIEVLKSNLLRL